MPKLSTSAGAGAKQKEAQKEENTLQEPNEVLLRSNIQSKLGYTGKAPSATTTPLAESISPSLSLGQGVISAQCALPGAALPALVTPYTLLAPNNFLSSLSMHPDLNIVSAAQMNKTGLATS